MSNNHYLFYHEYYKALLDTDQPGYKAYNRELTGTGLVEAAAGLTAPDGFILETMYPGLLAGLGYPHDIKKDDMETGGEQGNTADDAIRLGFSFDYVTGMPIIPGSTVKGVLRGAFRKGHMYIVEKLNGIGINDKAKVQTLEYALFGPWIKEGDRRETDAAHIGSRDVFLDAFPAPVENNARLLAIEHITPHSKPDDGIYRGLKAPQPLKLLKVKPGVLFLFRFILSGEPVIINDKEIPIDRETKLALYKSIIMDLGIGAKTNTGFGYMKEPVTIGDKTPKIKSVTVPTEGICKNCGEKTGFNAKTGKYHEYCSKCSQTINRG